MSKKEKENKQLLEAGQKSRAGRLFSEYLRGIGNEKTEVTTIFTDPDTGEKRIISKAEMLMRYIWEQALDGSDEKARLEYIKLILDRCEGKTGVQESNLPKRPSIPDKVSKKGKDRLNRIANNE